MLRRISCAIALLCALLALASAAGAAAPIPYVALGDSYSSGEGNGPFDSACHRAKHDDSAYPRILPSRVDYIAEPSFHACTGATIADVLQRPQPGRGDQQVQLEYLSPATRLVTLTIGGNDLGFEEIIKKCLRLRDCTQRQDLVDRIEGDMQTIKAELVDAYTRVRERMSPSGMLVVAGYPRLFSGIEARCGLLFSAEETAWINSLVIRGNRRIAEAVRATRNRSGNVAYVDVSERFAGHELCSKDPYLHRIKLALSRGLVKGSYHPNTAGQSAYAKSFAGFLRTPAIRTALTRPAR